MEIHLNQKVFNDTDTDNIYNDLSSITFPVSTSTRDQLILIFNKTLDPRIRDKIALIFVDLADALVIDVLVKKIDEIRYSRHISTLVYACSEYDCAHYIVFFVGLLIESDDSVYYEAIGVIESINSAIKLSDRIICVKLLNEYLLLIPVASEEYKEIEKIIEHIEGMPTLS